VSEENSGKNRLWDGVSFNRPMVLKNACAALQLNERNTEAIGHYSGPGAENPPFLESVIPEIIPGHGRGCPECGAVLKVKKDTVPLNSNPTDLYWLQCSLHWDPKEGRDHGYGPFSKHRTFRNKEKNGYAKNAAKPKAQPKQHPPAPVTENPAKARLKRYLEAGTQNILLVGPAGTGKTTLAIDLASELKSQFALVTLSKTTAPEKVFGYTGIVKGETKYVETEFVRVARDGGIIVIDEIDNGNANMIVELNAFLANGIISTPGGIVRRHKSTVVIACGNTYGTGPTRSFVGRQALDAATLDRFMTITVNYHIPFERSFVGGSDELWAFVEKTRKAIDSSGIPRALGVRAVQRLKVISEVEGLPPDEAFNVMTGVECENWKTDELSRIGIVREA